MRRNLSILFAFIFLLCAGNSLSAQDRELFKIRVTPQWTAQSQFAYLYLAEELGFYDEEGLDIEFVHVKANSTESAIDYFKEGKTDIVGLQYFYAVGYFAGGLDIHPILQVVQNSGLCIVSKTPIDSVRQLDGKKVACWFDGYAGFRNVLAESFNSRVQWVPSMTLINLYIYGAVDATLAYDFSELLKLELAQGPVPEENILRLTSEGDVLPEDGYYANSAFLDAHPEEVKAFVRATKKAVLYAMEHVDEAASTSLSYAQASQIVSNLTFQTIMFQRLKELFVNPATSQLDFAMPSEEIFNLVSARLKRNGLIDNEPDYKAFVR